MEEQIKEVIKKKHAGGRPPKYSKREEIEKLWGVYVDKCIKENKILTKAGWLYVIGLSREDYKRYKEREEFCYTLRELEKLIEDAWVQRLTQTGATGAIFYLKNAFKEDYKDRTETDFSGELKSIVNVFLPAKK